MVADCFFFLGLEEGATYVPEEIREHKTSLDLLKRNKVLSINLPPAYVGSNSISLLALLSHFLTNYKGLMCIGINGFKTIINMYTTHTYTYTYTHIKLNNLREEIQVVYHKEMFNKEVLLDCQNEKIN